MEDRHYGMGNRSSITTAEKTRREATKQDTSKSRKQMNVRARELMSDGNEKWMGNIRRERWKRQGSCFRDSISMT